MSALQKFQKTYNFNPFDLLKKINSEKLDFLKRLSFTSVVLDEAKNITQIDDENAFVCLLGEVYQEAQEKFPQNQKLDYVGSPMPLSVSPTNPNKPKSKGILEDFKSIVSKDELRPSTKGVYVDKPYMVATNNHMLVKDYVDENEFTEKFNKKIIDLPAYLKSKGDVIREINEKYPIYDNVIPTSNFLHTVTVDLYSLYNLALSTSFYLKLFDNSNAKLLMKIKDENFAINPILLADLSEYFLKKGVSKTIFKFSGRSKTLIFECGASLGLIMPIIANDDEFTGKDLSTTTTKVFDIEKLSEFSGGGETRTQTTSTTGTRRGRRPAERPAQTVQEIEGEPFKKFTGNIDDVEYISRRNIDKIILKDGTILTTNDIIDGIYKAKNKFAKGGMSEHGLKSGDKVVRGVGNDGIEVYNKYLRQVGTVNLNSGKRTVRKF